MRLTASICVWLTSTYCTHTKPGSQSIPLTRIWTPNLHVKKSTSLSTVLFHFTESAHGIIQNTMTPHYNVMIIWWGNTCCSRDTNLIQHNTFIYFERTEFGIGMLSDSSTQGFLLCSVSPTEKVIEKSAFLFPSRGITSAQYVWKIQGWAACQIMYHFLHFYNSRDDKNSVDGRSLVWFDRDSWSKTHNFPNARETT